jgi:isopentenyl-diphosphate Delta-isomerase
MTGGSEEGFRANRNLALAAERARIPVGMGSFRVLLEHEEVFDHFNLKRYAPDVPVLANIGGVQVREIGEERIVELAKRLETDAIVVHLNPGQELFQRDGDRDFTGIRDAVGRLCRKTNIPIIVKETGFGIAPDLIPELLDLGVAYVDLAGSGGTNWISVESYRADDELAGEASEFDDWGLPTAHLLAAIRLRYGTTLDGRILASGGLRTGSDMAKSIALGALLGGAALPLIRAEVDGGVDAVVRLLESMKRTIVRTMVLTGSRTVEALRSAPLWFRAPFAEEARSIADASRPGFGELDD